MDNQPDPTTFESLPPAMAQQLAKGVIDIKGLDYNGVAIVLFTLAEQLEAACPGTCARHGWVKLDDLQSFAASISAATQAKAPDGLH